MQHQDDNQEQHEERTAAAAAAAAAAEEAPSVGEGSAGRRSGFGEKMTNTMKRAMKFVMSWSNLSLKRDR